MSSLCFGLHAGALSLAGGPILARQVSQPHSSGINEEPNLFCFVVALIHHGTHSEGRRFDPPGSASPRRCVHGQGT